MKASKRAALLLALALGGAGLVRADIDTGLILHYAFDGDAGTVATDLSGQGNHGSFVDAGLGPDGASGLAATFDGSNDYVRVPASASLMPAEVTIAAWVRFDSLPAEVAALVFKRNASNSNNEDYTLQLNSAGGLRFVVANGIQKRLDSTNAMSPGEWHHVAATFAQPVMSVYVDGVLEGTANHNYPLAHNAETDLILGAADHKYYPLGSFFRGALDEVRIYGRALAAEEIAALANVAAPGAAGPIAHYTFDVDNGPIVVDDSGNGRTGTVHGATWVADGARGGAYRFDFNEQNILATDAGLPSGDAPRSIALWMKIDREYEDGCTGMFGYGTDNFNREFTGIGFDWRLDRDRVYFTPGGACFLTDRKVPAPGTWIHVAYTYGGNGDHHLYFDGAASDGMSELWGPVNTLLSGTLRLGGHPNGEGPAGGYLDDVRIYDRVLTAAEIAELAVPETGLVLHYTFDADEGGLVTDATGNGRTGTVHGATWVADGARGGAVRFADNSQSITATDAGLPSGDAPRTMAIWIKLDALEPEGTTGLFTYGAYSWNQMSGVGMDWRLDRDRYYFSQNGACFLAERKLEEPGRWHHLAYTYSGEGRHHLYVDGEPSDGMSELMGPVNTVLSGLLLLGGHPGSFGPQGGCLDDARIYDRALTAKEIAALAVPDDRENGLVAHYTFDVDDGPIVVDDSGNGRTGTVNGATWVADGARGGAYRFDGDTQNITASDAGLPSGDAPRSVALWMKIDREYEDGCTGMFGYGTDNFNREFTGIGFDWRLDRDRVYFSPGGACFLTAQKVPAPGTWIHVAYTYGGNGDHHLYCNGVLSDGMSELWGPVHTRLSGVLRMGGHPGNPGPDGGYLDDVRIYDRPLSAREVAELAGVEPPEEEPGPTNGGLVLHYSFDADDGTTATDLSGCGNHGRFVGAGLGPDGIGGQAAVFDGTNDYLRVPSRASLMPAEVTLAGWVRFDSLPTEVAALMFKRNPNSVNNEAYALQINSAGGLRFVLGNGGQTRLDSPAMVAGTWHHVAATFAQPVMSVYVDGVLAGTANHNYPLAHDATADLFFGAADNQYHPLGSFAHGALNEVRIYGRALGPEEIAALAGVAPAGTAGPIAHYTFDVDNGGLVVDDSGNGRTGTVNGATWVTNGVLGGAYRFDNNSQVITATDAGLPSGDAPRSIALWMKIDTTYTNGCTGMFGYGTDNFNKQFCGVGFDWRLDRDRAYFSPGGSCFLTAQKVPAPGIWFHVAYTYGGNGSHHLYYNGVLSDGMSELWGPVNTLLSGTLRMGGHPGSIGPDGGYLDDVRIYDRPLSAREVAELAAMNSGEEEPPVAGGDLVLHYSFDADDGTSATDLSGYGNHGQFAGAGLAPDEQGGKMATFDGIDDYLRVPSSASLMPAELTIAGWVRFDSPPTEVAALVFKRNPDDSNNEDYALQINRQGGLRFVLGNGGQTRLDSPAMVAGTWHHVAATFSLPVMCVYVDGVLAGTANHNYPLAHNAAADLFLGAADHSFYPMGSYLHGGLDDVRIYDQALTAEEIENLANVAPVEEEPPVSGGDLVLHYTYDADDGSTATDSSGYGNDGAVQGVHYLASGIDGAAADFDGTNAFIRVPWTNALKAADLSISAWLKIDAPPDALQSVVSKRIPGMANGLDYALQLTPAGAVRWTLAQHWPTDLDTPVLTTAAWHHVVATFSKPVMRLYLDGILVGTAQHFDDLAQNAAADVLIGAADDDAGTVGAFARCQMDELRLYKKILTEDEIETLAGSSGNGDLVLRYTFDGDSGGVVADSSGYGNQGVLNGAQIVADGMLADGAAFDGVDDYVRTASAESLMPAELTLSAWVRFDSLPQEVAELVFKRNSDLDNNESYALQIQSSGSLRFVLGNGGQTRLDSAPMGVGEWHHVAATFVRPAMKIYVDGALAGSAIHDYPLAHSPATDLLIGACDHATLPLTSFAHGMLDDVRIYKRALGDQEIAALVGQRIAEGVLDAQDADRDGVSNLAERRAGTDPLNDADQLAIQAMAFSAGGSGNVVLRWSSVPGLIYRILWAPDLKSGFVPLASGLMATETESAYTNKPAAGARVNFFVIQLQE